MKLKTRMILTVGSVLLLILGCAFIYIFRTQQAQTQLLYQTQADGVAYTLKLLGRTMTHYGGVFAEETGQVKLNPYLAKIPDIQAKIKSDKGTDFVMVSPFEIIQGMSKLSWQDQRAPFAFRVPSDKALNPMNDATPEEVTILDKMRDGDVLAVESKTTDKKGNSVFILNNALAPDRQCLGCHINYAPNRVEGMLSITLPIAVAEKAQANNTKILVAIFAVVLVLIMAVNYWLAGRITTPINELMIASNRISKGEQNIKINVKRNGEIGELAKAFNRMVVATNHSKEALDKRNNELSILLASSTAISSELDLSSTLNMLAERIVSATNSSFAGILLLTETENECKVEAVHAAEGFKCDQNITGKVKIEPDSVAFTVLLTHEPIVFESDELTVLNEDNSLVNMLPCNLENIQSFAIMPIHTKGINLGIIILGIHNSWHHDSFTREELDLTTSLVQYAGVAIHNAKLYAALQEMHLQTIAGLCESLETRDASSRNHSDRTMEYANVLAKELDLTQEEMDRLQYVAILHDVGKIGVPDNILNKPGKLSDEEFNIMKTHSEKGANIVSKIPFLEHIAPGIRHHHERWDGSGYPDAPKGDAIPIESRIVAVLDSFDAMITDRVYRKAPGIEYAMDELAGCSGTQFDPKVIEAFFKIIDNSPSEERTA